MKGEDSPHKQPDPEAPKQREAGTKRGIQFGASLDQETAEILTGQMIDPEIFDLAPTGNLLFVVVEKEPDDYGLIKMVKTYKEPSGCGYIIAAGPFAGAWPHPGGVAAIGVVSTDILDQDGLPGDEGSGSLLGLHVLFGAHSGVPIRVNMLEKRYDGQVIMMTSRDIQAIDLNPRPLTERVQDKINKKGEQLELFTRQK